MVVQEVKISVDPSELHDYTSKVEQLIVHLEKAKSLIADLAELNLDPEITVSIRR